MFEKIGRYAEKLAISAGQTRRGFLGLTGKGALSLASLVGGLLLFQDEAVADKSTCTGSCRYQCPDGSFISGGCTHVCNCESTRNHGGMTCNLFSSNCRFVWAEAPQAGTIRIEVWDGAVQNVSNAPPGWDYEVVDYDHLTSWRGNLDG
jgi:hypothetical protein